MLEYVHSTKPSKYKLVQYTQIVNAYLRQNSSKCCKLRCNGMQSFVSFDMVHVFKTLQLIEVYGHVSREMLCDELELGEGATRTLMKHLKMQNLIESTSNQTWWNNVFKNP